MNSRRRFIRNLASTTGLAAIGVACTRTGRDLRRYAPVKVARERIIRTVAGLRPYRPQGFVVRSEKLGGKTLVHNYGHGGGGITLSWGTAHLAMEMALAANGRCAVVGCGAVGLATAILLQREGREVTIYAKDLPPRTTSNIAGGQWFPASVHSPKEASPEYLDQFQRASRLAYRYYQDLVGSHYGVSWRENLFLGSKPFRVASFVDLLPDIFSNLEEIPPDDHPFPRPYAWRFAAMQIEPPTYLAALLRDFRLAGGSIVVREFHDANEIAALNEPIIVNCAGLGAKALFGDEQLRPVKGQLTVLLPQEEVDYNLLDAGLYMMPRHDGVLLGGSWEEDVWDLEPSPEIEESVLNGHEELFGRLQRA